MSEDRFFLALRIWWVRMEILNLDGKVEQEWIYWVTTEILSYDKNIQLGRIYSIKDNILS